MLELDEITYRAFHEELLKNAASWHGALSGGGAGLGLGALAGAGINAYRGYRDARAQGADLPGALVAGGMRAPMGALVGGGIGAGLGAGAGALSPGLGARLAHMPGIGAPVRLAQRQVHGFTEWEPHGGIESIGGGAFDAHARVRSAGKAVEEARHHAHHAQEAQDAGMTSIPGYLKALRKDWKGTLGKGFKEQWSQGGVGHKALTVGLPAIEAGQAALSEEDPNGPGKGERIGRGLASGAGGLVTGSLPFTGQMAVGAGLGLAGSMIGRGIDKLRGRSTTVHAPPIAPYKDEPSTGSEVRLGAGMMNGGSL